MKVWKVHEKLRWESDFCLFFLHFNIIKRPFLFRYSTKGNLNKKWKSSGEQELSENIQLGYRYLQEA